MRRRSYLATGTVVTAKRGAPTVRDMSIALCRIPRFAGNGWLFFPVALHSMIVADLLPKRLKVYGLVHDGPEAVGSDVPTPFKSKWTKQFEKAIFRRMLRLYGLPRLSRKDTALLKAADIASLHAEAWTVGPPGGYRLFRKRYREVERMVKAYAAEFPPLACVRRGGRAPREFVRRFNLYMKLYRDTLS